MAPLNPETNGKRRHRWFHITDMSYTMLFLLWTELAVFFALAYFLLGIFAPEHAPEVIVHDTPIINFLNSLYYSVITATSTGYGDITPRGFSKALAGAQSISALFVFAIFVTKLVSQRQEIALQEVHKLTYEDIFHNTRGDLYIIRKDLDVIIEEAKKDHALSDDSWDRLMIALQQAQSLLAEIPDFYDGGNIFYQIDAKREQLLLEGVHRTLHRFNETFDALSRFDIDWASQQKCMDEIHELMHVIDHVTPLWQERSPYQKREAFEDIVLVKAKTRDWIEQSLPRN